MSAASNDNSHQKAKEIGWAFVQEYYKYFNEKPEELHLFYKKNSRLIRGLEGEEVKVCKGIQEIKKNISDMQLKDAHVNITNVDSLDLLDAKVLVQVTGRFSNKDEAYRKFVQTIVLDTQPGGYYVLEHIFRNFKEEADEVVKQQQTDQGSTYIDDGVSSIIEEKLNGEDSVSTLSTGTLAEESTQEISRDSKVVEEADSSIPAKVGVPEVPALPKSETEDIPSSVTEEPADNESKSIESGPSEKATQVTVQTKISTTAAQLTSPTQSPSKTQTSSWASLAASGSSKWDTSQLAEPSKGRVIPASQLTRTQSQTSNTREAPRDRNSNREFSLYVKVGNERMNYEALMSAFSNFGPVKNLDVVPAKSCAFVEFQTQDAYQRALQQRQIPVPGFGNETVIVEERQERRKDDNSRYRGRQSYDNYQRNYGQAPHNAHNGMNSQRGGRGGDRRNVPRLPAKSPS
ncbi:28305_t:CDS:2 [Dentiscutata erythropus]|uniref:28305_t:CDS:1 n=1 Tax=Dentiscutata erythropus TaxID=1348616 RepID=A0A9N9J3S9_9GLOM|nr:28305_t:CDS:2 [Dentiscutata erythropus]